MNAPRAAKPVFHWDDPLLLEDQLSEDERQRAPQLHLALQAIRQGLMDGKNADALIAEHSEMLTRAGFEIDYLEWRDANSLGPAQSGPNRLLVAAKLGNTRLIDNIAAD